MLVLTIALLAATAPGRHVPVAPAESLWVEVAGSGESVVLVPGLAGSAFAFRHLAPLLHARGLRTIVIEPLGIGSSSRPASADYSLTAQSRRLAAVLDSLGESDAVVVAHSVAVSMALRLALHRRDLVRALVSLDGGAAESATSPSMRRALRFAPLLRVFGGRGRVRKELIDQLIEASGDPAWVTDSVADAYARPVVADLGASLRAYQAMARAREPERLDRCLDRVSAPVLLLHGAAPHKTAGLTQSEVDALTLAMPGMTVHALPGVGHYVHEEQPELVAEVVVQFAFPPRERHAALLPDRP